jgi:hypothetical protein
MHRPYGHVVRRSAGRCQTDRSGGRGGAFPASHAGSEADPEQDVPHRRHGDDRECVAPCAGGYERGVGEGVGVDVGVGVR